MDTTEILKIIDRIITDASNLRRIVLGGKPVFPKDKLELVAEKRCLKCKKAYGNKRIVRGNHESCYRAIHRRINDGDLTDFEAVQNGFLTPRDFGTVDLESSDDLAAYIASRDVSAAAKNTEKVLKETLNRSRKKP